MGLIRRRPVEGGDQSSASSPSDSFCFDSGDSLDEEPVVVLAWSWTGASVGLVEKVIVFFDFGQTATLQAVPKTAIAKIGAANTMNCLFRGDILDSNPIT